VIAVIGKHGSEPGSRGELPASGADND